MTSPTRRPALPARIRLALPLALAVLAACSEPPEAFHSTDVTGAGFGRHFDFGLRDAAGREHRLADHRGRVVALFFGFTQCPDVCPTALARFAAIKKALGEDGRRLRVLFITLDPDRDTPELMGRYAAAFDPEFIGLRGDAEATRRVAGEFRVFYRRVPTGSSYTLDHSALGYVFDGRGRLRLALRPGDDIEALEADLRRLIRATAS